MPAQDAQLSSRPNGLGGRVELRYVARAGLLPELSRQTYDGLHKALREAVLNALDADAGQVTIDFSRIGDARELTVSDDGTGMSTRQFCEQFMSLGGSSKFGDDTRFGRIGIGSLALLQYARAATVETKTSGATTATHARIEHPWNLQRDARRARLGDMAAGHAEEVPYTGEPSDHFTRLRLEGVSDEVATLGRDPAAFYELVDALRRILPLPWVPTRLTEALAAISAETVGAIERHISDWSASVIIHSPWERNIRLSRRTFGEDQAGIEDWTGPPVPILKRIRMPGSEAGAKRTVLVAGFLINQKRAQSAWAGITARVQNVAVEEHTFFDVTSDPGFRKYISGEVWVLGDVDRERLINIDRSSFNRDCVDYQAIQRFMARAIVEFKASSVQRPQRQKVQARRAVEDHIRALRAIDNVLARAADVTAARGATGLPSSEAGRRLIGARRGLAAMLAETGADIIVDSKRPYSNLKYDLDLSSDGRRIEVTVGPGLAQPRATAGKTTYRVVYVEADPAAPPVVVRNRPREIAFNTRHPAHVGVDSKLKYQLSLALELAYLLDGDASDTLYERMVAFMGAL